jgi:hypothetical protein
MRTLTAIAAALGFFLATSAPSLAATTTTDHATVEFAAAKKKVDCKNPKNAKNKACAKKMDKKSELSTTFSAATKKVNCKLKKNAKNKACAKKMDKKSELSVTFSAAKKKVNCKDPKNAKNKACMTKKK